MEKLPCIDCITLAICKSIYIDKYRGLNSEQMALSALITKCELIEKFVFIGDYMKYSNRVFSVKDTMIKDSC